MSVPYILDQTTVLQDPKLGADHNRSATLTQSLLQPNVPPHWLSFCSRRLSCLSNY